MSWIQAITALIANTISVKLSSKNQRGAPFRTVVDAHRHHRHTSVMDSQVVIQRLNRNKTGLQALGLKQLSLFGSTARGDATAASDIDLAVTLDEGARIDLFRFAAISERLSQMLDAKVDLVIEPARNARMQSEIDRDRLRVF